MLHSSGKVEWQSVLTVHGPTPWGASPVDASTVPGELLEQDKTPATAKTRRVRTLRG